MAQAVANQDVEARIDRYLQYLLREWNSLPWVFSEWTNWEEHERLNFVLEWPIREDRLLQLRDWEERGLLAPEQQRDFNQLLGLIEIHRPQLDRLLAE
jgi:hypothetical protein